MLFIDFFFCEKKLSGEGWNATNLSGEFANKNPTKSGKLDTLGSLGRIKNFFCHFILWSWNLLIGSTPTEASKFYIMEVWKEIFFFHKKSKISFRNFFSFSMQYLEFFMKYSKPLFFFKLSFSHPLEDYLSIFENRWFFSKINMKIFK